MVLKKTQNNKIPDKQIDVTCIFITYKNINILVYNSPHFCLYNVMFL